MREMKDSGIEWIGQIPQGWHVDRLKYCADLDSEKLSEKTDPEYAFNYIDISSVTEYGGIGSTQEMTFDKSPSRARMIVHDGDTIISTVRTYLKAIAYIDGLEDHICSTGFCVVTPNEKLHPKFGYYLLQSDYFVQKIVSESVGVSYPAISSTEIGNMSIAIPDPEEQTRIALHLDNKCAEIDTLIAAKEKTNALLKERRQSIIYEAVTKGLNPNAPMKDSGIEWIGEIPESWAVGKLGYFIEVFNGDRSSNYPSGSDIQESGVPFLTSSNLEYDVLDMSSSKYISEEKYESMSGLKMELNDIIYCLRGSVGKCSINKTETCGTVASSLMGIRCKKMEPEFLLFVLKSPVIETQNALFMNGTCAANLSAENVCGYLVPIPAKAEQTAIAEYLQDRCTEMDELISANEATIQKLKEYRQSIIYEAVTGKIEI